MECKEMYPLSAQLAQIVDERAVELKRIFTGESDKMVLIIGPCSADREDAVMDYLMRLRDLADKVSDKIFIVPRIYTNKPRTTGAGYKGMLHQPDPEAKPDLFKGIVAIRQLHMRALAETGFSAADEMLYPENYKYLDDVLAYSAMLILIICAYINQWLFLIIASLILSTTFSINFLIESVRKIQKELEEDINKARKSMSYLVSRNTSELTESRIASAAIETLTENITDSIISPLLYTSLFILIFGSLLGIYGIIIGLLTAIIYRVSNTMDAMLGYQTPELINIGCYPAKWDDILNYIPARITGYYVILASLILRYDYKQSYDVMKKFARKTPSPNSGYSMAATAGAINVTLVKEGVYELGYGTDELDKNKISQAINITKVTSVLFILTIVLIYFIIIFIIM